MAAADNSPVELTRSLVRIPSENPNGTEAAMAAFVADWLGRLPGVELEVSEVLPNRPNVVARLRGTSNQPPLAFLAHMDTVPRGDGWKSNPLGGEIIDGKLYGRGACDMKSGLAVAMTALARAAQSGTKPSRDFVVCATMDEEGTHMLGVTDLVRRGILDSDSLVIATEPTDLKVVVAHKGLVWIEVEIRGKLAHAGNPQFGVDAIRAAAEFITRFKRAIDELPDRHPTLGRTEVTFSGIKGGIKTNVVPDYARLEMDIRLPPPLTIEDIRALSNTCAREAEGVVIGAHIECRQLNNDRPPVEADVADEFCKAMCGTASTVTGAADVVAVFPAYTDASVVQARTGNRHCLVFGPGRLAEAHTIDEYVLVEQIEKAAAALDAIVRRMCFSA
jgi:succinyl-diaminopimelate desuccinylase